MEELKWSGNVKWKPAFDYKSWKLQSRERGHYAKICMKKGNVSQEAQKGWYDLQNGKGNLNWSQTYRLGLLLMVKVYVFWVHF